MEIAYENNLDDWITAQLFNLDQLTSLKKYDRKAPFIMLVFFVALGIFIYLLSGANALLNVFIFLVFASVFLFLLLNKKSKQRIIYKRLHIAYGQQLDTQKDKLVRWQTAPEHIIIQNAENESRISWSSVQKVTLCPQYLFLNFGSIGFAWLPQRSICTGDYDVFVQNFTTCYQDYAKSQNMQAMVIQSDWMIDIDTLKDKALWKLSVKRLFFILLWWLAFLFGAIVLLGAIALGIGTIAAILGYESEGKDPFEFTLVMTVLIGSALIGLLGLILGFLEKLPGTKPKKV
jgi:Ca2+/Na+ antiporter